MSIVITCTCGKRLRAKDDVSGKRTKCPGCGSILVVPLKEPVNRQANTIDAVGAEDGGRKPPYLWIGLSVLCVVLISGAFVADRKMKTSRANEAVSSKILEAKQAAVKRRWAAATSLLREALAVEGATDLRRANQLLIEVNRSKANEVVAEKVKAAQQASLSKQWDQAIEILQKAVRVEDSTTTDGAKKLLAIAEAAKSRDEAERMRAEAREREAVAHRQQGLDDRRRMELLADVRIEDRAKDLIRHCNRYIARCAQGTARYKGFDFLEKIETGNGFKHKYAFYYEGVLFNTAHRIELAFYFNANGGFENKLDVVNFTRGLFKPFFGGSGNNVHMTFLGMKALDDRQNQDGDMFRELSKDRSDEVNVFRPTHMTSDLDKLLIRVLDFQSRKQEKSR